MMTAATTLVEHVYAARGVTWLRAVVHAPTDVREPRPAILLFHGGGWRSTNLPQFAEQCDRLAELGMVAIRAEYRVSDVHGTTPIESMADARTAIRWARGNAAMLGIDAERLAVGGGSAGGHLAACAALCDASFDATDDRADISCRPDALVLFNPVLDTSPATGFMPTRFGDRALSASPLHCVCPHAPPTLVQHGTNDEAVPIETARAFARAMRNAGNHCELIEYAGARHGFFNRAADGSDAFEPTFSAAARFLASLRFCAEIR